MRSIHEDAIDNEKEVSEMELEQSWSSLSSSGDLRFSFVVFKFLKKIGTFSAEVESLRSVIEDATDNEKEASEMEMEHSWSSSIISDFHL